MSIESSNIFELRLRQRDISSEDLLADLQSVAKKLGIKTITRVIYDEHGSYGTNTFLRKFGSWNNALSAAGLSLSCRINIPDEEIFKNLADLWQILGRQPVGRDLSKQLGLSNFSLGLYEKRFGSWNKALVAFEQYIKCSEDKILISATEVQSSLSSKRTPRRVNWRLRATVLIRDSCICRMCGASPAKDPSVQLHVDHIKSWTKGGETTIENLQTLCSVCNIGKSNALDGVKLD